MCDRWLAVNKDDGTIKRILNVSDSFINSDPSLLIRKNISQGIFEDHIWLSVGYRAKKSFFTRAQRLGACMATLFLAMISNCMLFKSADETPSSTAIKIGPISITPTQITNSIVTSAIVIPPMLIITMCFSKSKQKLSTIAVQGRIAAPQAKLWLPFWFVYIGWFFVFLSILVPAFFTILYSFQWGKEKSTSWLTAFLLSFVESAILVQPFKASIQFNIVTFKLNLSSFQLSYFIQNICGLITFVHN